MGFIELSTPRPHIRLLTLNRPERMNAMAFDVMIPLREALEALSNDSYLVTSLGQEFVNYMTTLKRSELRRFEEAPDKLHFQSCEYFARI